MGADRRDAPASGGPRPRPRLRRADLAALEPASVPGALAELHRSLPVGTPLVFDLPAALGRARAVEVIDGGGFVDAVLGDGLTGLTVDAVRARTLPDEVGPGLRLVVCGLNPSLYAADRGIGFARPGNRFWPAARAAGIASRDRDPAWLRRADRVGMTDLVKRATTGADELTADEYRAGVARVERLVEWLQPGAVCFVGLAGWRSAVDRRAVTGPLPDGFGGRPAYLMPSTSGLNAHSSLDDLAMHLRAALALADPAAPRSPC